MMQTLYKDQRKFCSMESRAGVDELCLSPQWSTSRVYAISVKLSVLVV